VKAVEKGVKVGVNGTKAMRETTVRAMGID